MAIFSRGAATISINVNATGVSLPIAISVCLQRVAVERTVITAIPDPVSVRVKLPRVVHERAVVLRKHTGDVNIHLVSV